MGDRGAGLTEDQIIAEYEDQFRENYNDPDQWHYSGLARIYVGEDGSEYDPSDKNPDHWEVAAVFSGHERCELGNVQYRVETADSLLEQDLEETYPFNEALSWIGLEQGEVAQGVSNMFDGHLEDATMGVSQGFAFGHEVDGAPNEEYKEPEYCNSPIPGP